MSILFGVCVLITSTCILIIHNKAKPCKESQFIQEMDNFKSYMKILDFPPHEIDDELAKYKSFEELKKANVKLKEALVKYTLS